MDSLGSTNEKNCSFFPPKSACWFSSLLCGLLIHHINFRPVSSEQLSGWPLCSCLHQGPLLLYLTPSPTLHPSICPISPLAGSLCFICSAGTIRSRGAFRFPCSGCHLPRSSSFFPFRTLRLGAAAVCRSMHYASAFFWMGVVLQPVNLRPGHDLHMSGCDPARNALPFKQAGTSFPRLITPAGTSVPEGFFESLFFYSCY